MHARIHAGTHTHAHTHTRARKQILKTDIDNIINYVIIKQLCVTVMKVGIYNTIDSLNVDTSWLN